MLNRRSFLTLTAVTVAGGSIAMPSIGRAAARELRLGHTAAAGSNFDAGAKAFQAFLAEKSGGRLSVQIFPSAIIGNDIQMAKAVSDGALDLHISSIAGVADGNPDLMLAEFPYLFASPAAARNALDTGLGKHYAEILDKRSTTVLAFGENGFRHVTANRPVRRPQDLQGLKIRVQQNQLHIEAFNGLGAVAEPLAFSELQTAMQSGRFEAQENPIGILTSTPFIPKVQSHLSLTGHVYSPNPICASGDMMAELPEPDRAILRGAGIAAAKAMRDFNDRAVVSGLEMLKAAGMTVVTDVDIPAFQAAMAGLSDRLAKVAGPDALQRVRQLVA